MTLGEKIREVGLTSTARYENVVPGIQRLCIPRLTLQDGPNGIATGDTGVTQLPASLGVAASFDPSLAYDYGRVLGAEARSQGIDVVQGPNLNLARLPNTARIYEGYGEDPLLVSEMGVGDIEGIQSQGVMAEAKHFSAYTQETARLSLNQVVSNRALEEVYLAPFRAAVEQGHVKMLMCAYGKINGVAACSDKTLFNVARRNWGFAGVIRSDLGAVSDPVAAFNAGLDLIKPAVPVALELAVRERKIPIARLNAAVLSVLTAMFAQHLIEKPPRGKTHTLARTPGHAAIALEAAERSIVLLKNLHQILPLNRTHLGSVAIIGEDAGQAAAVAGYGGARVVAPFVITPLEAIRAWVGRHTKVSFSPGGPGGESLTTTPQGTVADVITANPSGVVTPAVTTATQPGMGPGWERWSTRFTPITSGLYDFSMKAEGDTWIFVNSAVLIADPGLHGPAPWSTTLQLVAGRSYVISVRWFQTGDVSVQRTGAPELSWADVSPMIAAASAAARHSSVAIVFVSDFSEEGFDRPTLSLPSDANALILAVAKANPRTIVVLNTGGAVLMPWLANVAGVLEGWYPGEEDGAAITAVLSDAVDPSGHLPITFPRSDGESPMAMSSSWPGVNGSVQLGGLDVGYRFYDEAHLSPLFPFGFGLSYTRFAITGPTVTNWKDGVKLTVRVANTGAYRGKVVVQAYLSFPASADEPPFELKAIATARLNIGGVERVTLSLPSSAFEIYRQNHFTAPSGAFTVSIGQSERDLPLKLRLSAPVTAASLSTTRTNRAR
jgi:beta-glucosidase